MKITAHLLFALLLGLTSQAQPLIGNVDARSSIDLNGDWHYIIDRYNNGIYNFHMKIRHDGYFKDAVQGRPDQLVEYGFDDSPTMKILGDWNTADPQLYYYEGAVWFQRDFDLDVLDTLVKDYQIWIGAANYIAHVWINGEFLGEHEGGFTPFNFNANPALKAGKNSIVVRVENERKPDRIPTINTDWWNYGGITRDVKLLALDKTHIVNYKVGLAENRQSGIVAQIHTTSKGAGKLVIPELKVNQKFETDATGKAKLEVKAKPQLWSPETPKLYAVEIHFEKEIIRDTIGFRTIATKSHQILLNGESVKLKGICIHEESRNETGRANGYADAKQQLTLAKEMGCNYVRLAHYPHNRYMTKMADQLGLMVWSEIPVYWTVQFENDEVYANAEAQLRAMIERDQNRASIVIWSMANETPLGDERTAFLTNLANKSRELDPTRLVSAALLTHGNPNDPNQIMIDDPLGAALDIVSINEYIGWYWASPEKCDSVSFELAYDKPLIISEFGGGAKAGMHGKTNEIWTEEFQEKIYQHNVALFEREEEVAGISPWILVDFRSPRRLLPNIQDGWNRKGVIAPDGSKKKAFYVMKAFYEKW